MKKRLLLINLICAFLFNSSPIHAKTDQPSAMLQLADDNDCYNLRKGRSTDRGYTNGTGITYYYTKAHRSSFFADRLMPKAGDSSINIYSIAGMHVMYTPSNSCTEYYQPGDYSWAGAVYFTNTLHSYNARKKYSLQTSLVAGIMGPIALGKMMQTTLHKMIKDPGIPKGWDNQFHNDLLLNMNFTMEKQIAHIDRYMQLIASGQLMAGTLTNALDLGPVIMIGKMNPYFNGLLQQFAGSLKQRNKLRAYLKFKPGVQLVAWNSLLQGGIFTEKPLVKVSNTTPSSNDVSNVIGDEYIRQPRPDIANIVTYITGGLVVAYGGVNISYTQTHTSELIKNTYSHSYGNVSISYAW